MKCPTCNAEYVAHGENTHCIYCEKIDYLVEEHMIKAREIGKDKYAVALLSRLASMPKEDVGGDGEMAIRKTLEELSD